MHSHAENPSRKSFLVNQERKEEKDRQISLFIERFKKTSSQVKENTIDKVNFTVYLIINQINSKNEIIIIIIIIIIITIKKQNRKIIKKLQVEIK